VDDPHALTPGEGAGVLFLVPGVTETLRINGRVSETGGDIRIAADEVFIHCGKALIRSGFWSAAPIDAPDEPAAFLERTRFIALATANRDGRADMSPKGDPAGQMLRLTDGGLVFADRPGNRRADGFRNIIEQPETAALALVPGATMVARLCGRVQLTRDEALRAPFEVEGKMPQLASVMENADIELRESAALKRAALWPVAESAGEGVDPSAILVAHVKLNKTKGEQATAMRGATTRGMVAKGLEDSYKHRLY
jgi:predicted pyridoxine 5'-phosphate oxidase superfamily flavin-nucleotide-binding protein